jgi:TPR repeat protein
VPSAEAALTPPQRAIPDPVATAPAPRMLAKDVASLLTSGDAMLRTGDVTAARLYYELATEAENPEAALRLGKTYDRAYLALNGLNGIYADAAVAARWYQYAQALGSDEAGAALAGVVSDDGTANPSNTLDKLFEQFLTSGKEQ